MPRVDFPAQSLIELLRKTVRELESSPEYSEDDPVIQRYRRSLALAITELELRKRRVVA